MLGWTAIVMCFGLCLCLCLCGAGYINQSLENENIAQLKRRKGSGFKQP
jgi:hypothetical protein